MEDWVDAIPGNADVVLFNHADERYSYPRARATDRLVGCPARDRAWVELRLG